MESLASIDEDVAVSKLVPSGEAETHIDEVWATLQERLHEVALACDGTGTCISGRRVQGNFISFSLAYSCRILAKSCLLLSCLVCKVTSFI